MVNSCNCKDSYEIKYEINIVTIDTNIQNIRNSINNIETEEDCMKFIEDEITIKKKKTCFICCKKKNDQEFIKLECCNSEEFCKECISIWVSSNTNKNCPKCRSKDIFHKTCKKNNITVANTIQYYLNLYNLQHPSYYFSSPQEMEDLYNKYINNTCRDSLCYMAKLYTCMCSTCLRKLCTIQSIKNSEHGSALNLEEIISIIDIMTNI